MKIKNSTYFLLAVVGIFLIAISPQLFSHGMFMDGVYYATVARNMAEGQGTFWSPQLTETLGKNFHEHPPLAFGLQSLFFSAFGDHHWVERLYSLLCYLIAGGLVISLWKKVASSETKSLLWLPLLLWLTVPKMVWGVSNNLLENTMMLFLLGSVIFQIKALNSTKNWLFFVAGFMLFLGFLSKGFTSLFPLSFLFFYWVFLRPFSFLDLVKKYFIFIGGLSASFALLFILMPHSFESLSDYYTIQIIGGLGGEQSVDSRFYIVRRVSQEILTMILLAVTIFGFWKFQNKSATLKVNAKVYVFACTALSGVLPILISMKQSTFYAIPAFPLFALSFSLFMAPFVERWLQKFELNLKGFRTLKIGAILLFSIGTIVILLPINQTNRDKIKLGDIHTVMDVVDENSRIGIHKSIRREWSYYAYFYRYGRINIDYEFDNNTYVIAPKGVEFEIKNYSKLELNLKSIDLFIKK